MESPLTADEIKLRDKTLTELGELMRVMDNPNSTVFEMRVKTRATLDLLAKLEVEFLQKLSKSRSTNLLPPSPAAFWKSRPLDSSQERKTVLHDNIVYLIQHTSNWPVLKPLLLQTGLLSEPEIQNVENESNDESRHYRLFTTIARKKDWIEKVAQCLNKSQNEHVADVIVAARNKLIRDYESSENNCTIGKDTLKEVLATHASNIQECESTRVTLDNNRAALDNQIEIAKKEKRKLEIKVELLTMQLRDAMDAEINSTYELECLQNKIQTLNAEKQDLDMQLTQCNLRIETLNAQLSEQTAQLAKNEFEMRELQATKAELEQRLVQLESAHQIERENASKSNENLLELLELKHSAQILEFSRQISALQKRRAELECGRKERPVPPKKPLLRCSTQSGQPCTDARPSVIVAKDTTSEANDKNSDELNSGKCQSREIEQNPTEEVWSRDLDQDRVQIQQQQRKLTDKINMFESLQIGGNPIPTNDLEIPPNLNQFLQLPPSSEQNSNAETETEMDVDFEQIAENLNEETTTEIQNPAKNESEDQTAQKRDSDHCLATTSEGVPAVKEKIRMFESQQIVIKPRAQDLEFVQIPTLNDEPLEDQTVECVALCLNGNFKLFQPLQHNICENLGKLKLEYCTIEPKSFLNSIRPCKSLTSIQLISITLTKLFKEIIDLPSLREYKVKLNDRARLPIQDYTSLLFWAKVNDFEFNTLANLNVDIVRIEIHHHYKYTNPTAEFDRHNCKYLKNENFMKIKIHMQSCALHEPKVDVRLKVLELDVCTIHSSCIPSNLISLKLFDTEVIGGFFDDVLKSMHNLKELTLVPRKRTVINLASIPIVSLCTVWLTNTGLHGQVKGLKEGHTGPPLRCPRKWYLERCDFDEAALKSFPYLLKDATHLKLRICTVDGESDASIVHEVLKIQSLEFLDVDMSVNLKRLAKIKSELSKYPMFANKLNDIGKHSSQNFFLYFKLSKTAGKWNCLDLYTANSLETTKPVWW